MMCESDDEIRTRYRRFTTEELLQARGACQREWLGAKDPAMAERRLALIDQEFTARNTALRI